MRFHPSLPPYLYCKDCEIYLSPHEVSYLLIDSEVKPDRVIATKYRVVHSICNAPVISNPPISLTVTV